MLEGINGYRPTDRKVWIHDCDGGRSRIFCLFCMADNHKNYRPNHIRHEEDYNQIDRPTSPTRPRYDTITGEAEYSFEN